MKSSEPYPFADFSKDQLIVKIVHDIVSYEEHNQQVKLSLLQDLVIISLTNVTESEELGNKLNGIRCHTPSENVVQWFDKMAKVFLKNSNVISVLDGFTKTQLSTEYY